MSAPADLRTRVEKRVQEMKDQGASDDEILAAGKQILAEEQARPAPTEAPEKTLMGRVPGAIADVAEFANEAGNSFIKGGAGAVTAGYLGSDESARRAKEQYSNANRLAKMGALSPQGLRQAQRDYEAAMGDQADTAAHPVASAAGNIAGSMYGPGGMIARNIAGKAPTLARGLLAGGVGGGVDAATRALVEGKGAGKALDEGAMGSLVGAGLGGSMHVLGEALRNPLGETGATIQALNRGREFLASPENAALPKGMRGIGALAADEGEKLGQLQAQKLQASRGALESAESALPVDMNEPISVANVHRRLNRSVDRYSNTRAVRPDVERAIGNSNVDMGDVGGIKANLSKVTRQRIEPVLEDMPPGIAGPPQVKGFRQGEEVITPQATPSDLLKQRRAVRQQAQFGTPETPENAPYRELSRTLSEATHDPTLPNGIGAKLAASDAQFSADMEKLAEGNALLFGKDDARAVTDSLQAGRAASSKLSQSLMDTRAGGAQLRTLEKIRALGPEYQAAVDRVAAKIAEQGSEFAIKPKLMGGKWFDQVPLQNLRALNVQLTEPFTRANAAHAAMGSVAGQLLTDPLDAALRAREAKNSKKEKSQ